MHPGSKFYLAINIGYPNNHDQENNCTGDYIMIHGQGGSKGCFAMKNKCMEEIYMILHLAFQKGHTSIPLHIFPFPMTDYNLRAFRRSSHFSFWKSLQKAYKDFETFRVPSRIIVKDKKYLVAPW